MWLAATRPPEAGMLSTMMVGFPGGGLPRFPALPRGETTKPPRPLVEERRPVHGRLGGLGSRARRGRPGGQRKQGYDQSAQTRSSQTLFHIAPPLGWSNNGRERQYLITRCYVNRRFPRKDQHFELGAVYEACRERWSCLSACPPAGAPGSQIPA